MIKLNPKLLGMLGSDVNGVDIAMIQEDGRYRLINCRKLGCGQI